MAIFGISKLNLNPDLYGCVKDESNKALLQMTLPDNVAVAPISIVKLIKCGSGKWQAM